MRNGKQRKEILLTPGEQVMLTELHNRFKVDKTSILHFLIQLGYETLTHLPYPAVSDTGIKLKAQFNRLSNGQTPALRDKGK